MEQKYIDELTDFIVDYMGHLLGAGVHTARVIRNSKRIGQSLGADVSISTFQKSAIVTVKEKGGCRFNTRVVDIPAFPISFAWNSDLSALSWKCYDEKLSLEQAKAEFENLVKRPRIPHYAVLTAVGLANASFCFLFGGEWSAMLVVFLATVAGFQLKHFMTVRKVNHYVTFITSAFTASLISASAIFLGIDTAEIALATSVLYLVPGVPLINGVIDITDGHILIGISRLVNALILIVCIAIGMSATLMMVKDSLL